MLVILLEMTILYHKDTISASLESEIRSRTPDNFQPISFVNFFEK